MRSVVIVIQCDICKSEITESEVVETLWTWEGFDLVIETCPPCFDVVETEATIKQLLGWSRKVESDTSKNGNGNGNGKRRSGATGRTWKRYTLDDYLGMYGNSADMLVCPDCTSAFKDINGMRGHLSKVHGKTMWQEMEKALLARDQVQNA